MKHPEPNAICDISGKKYPISEMRTMWNGLYVHKTQYEKRQPQDFVKPVRVPKPILNARPDKDPVFATEAIPANVILTEDGTPMIMENELSYMVTE